MIKEINLARKKKAIYELSLFLRKDYYQTEVKLTNLHIKKLNDLYNSFTFKHNDAFISGSVVYKILHKIEKDSEINYHQLTPEQLYLALVNIKNSNCYFKTKENRFVILTSVKITDGSPIIVVVEINADLQNKLKANINKIVTIYPKRNILSYLEAHNAKIKRA